MGEIKCTCKFCKSGFFVDTNEHPICPDWCGVCEGALPKEPRDVSKN